MWGTLLWIVLAVAVAYKQAYSLFLHFVYAGTNTYFRHIRVYGINNLPREGPVILCPNHCNMMMDPFVVVSQCFKHGRRPYIWAKGSLFNNVLTAWLLRGLGGVPVYRPSKGTSGVQDKDSDMSPSEVEAANKRMFEHTWQVLANGNSMVLFPEGTSYTEPKMLPLRTGVMRAATGFVKNYQQPLPIVPVGVTYSQKDKFRSNVVLEFGSAFLITPEQVEAEAFVKDERAEIKRLTEHLNDKMREVTVNAESFETIRAAKVMQRMYLSTGAAIADEMRVRLTQAIVDMLEQEPKDSEQATLLKETRAKVLEHDQKLAKSRLQRMDTLLSADWNAMKQTLFERIMYFTVLLPFGLIGLALNSPFYLLAYKLDVGMKYVESKSMLKLMVPGLCIPVQWFILSLIAWFLGGNYVAYATMVALPVLLFAHIHILDEACAIFDYMRLAFFQFVHRDRLEALRTEHQELAKTISILVKEQVDPAIVASVQKSIEIAESSPKHSLIKNVLPLETVFPSFDTSVRAN